MLPEPRGFVFGFFDKKLHRNENKKKVEKLRIFGDLSNYNKAHRPHHQQQTEEQQLRRQHHPRHHHHHVTDDHHILNDISNLREDGANFITPADISSSPVYAKTYYSLEDEEEVLPPDEPPRRRRIRLLEIANFYSCSSHPNVCKPIQMNWREDSLQFIFPDCGASILTRTRKGGMMRYSVDHLTDVDSPYGFWIYSEAAARVILAQLLSALKHLHLQGIFHLDLRPENVLVGGVTPSDLLFRQINNNSNNTTSTTIDTNTNNSDANCNTKANHIEAHNKKMNTIEINTTIQSDINTNKKFHNQFPIDITSNNIITDKPCTPSSSSPLLSSSQASPSSVSVSLVASTTPLISRVDLYPLYFSPRGSPPIIRASSHVSAFAPCPSSTITDDNSSSLSLPLSISGDPSSSSSSHSFRPPPGHHLKCSIIDLDSAQQAPPRTTLVWPGGTWKGIIPPEEINPHIYISENSKTQKLDNFIMMKKFWRKQQQILNMQSDKNKNMQPHQQKMKHQHQQHQQQQVQLQKQLQRENQKEQQQQKVQGCHEQPCEENEQRQSQRQQQQPQHQQQQQQQQQQQLHQQQPKQEHHNKNIDEESRKHSLGSIGEFSDTLCDDDSSINRYIYSYNCNHIDVIDGAKKDVYALGCLLCMMITGYHPYICISNNNNDNDSATTNNKNNVGAHGTNNNDDNNDNNNNDFINDDSHWDDVSRSVSNFFFCCINGHPPGVRKFEWISPQAQDLIEGMVCADPLQRLSIEAVDTHPWMTNN